MPRMILAASMALAALWAAGLPAGAAPDEAKGDFARGAKYYSDNCARCHNARPPTDHRPREWSMVVQHMRIIAGLPGEQTRDIYEFLRRSSIPAPTQ